MSAQSRYSYPHRAYTCRCRYQGRWVVGAEVERGRMRSYFGIQNKLRNVTLLTSVEGPVTGQCRQPRSLIDEQLVRRDARSAHFKMPTSRRRRTSVHSSRLSALHNAFDSWSFLAIPIQTKGSAIMESLWVNAVHVKRSADRWRNRPLLSQIFISYIKIYLFYMKALNWSIEWLDLTYQSE